MVWENAVILQHSRPKIREKTGGGLKNVYLKSNCESKVLRFSSIRKQKHALLKSVLNKTMCHTPMYVMLHFGVVRPAIEKDTEIKIDQLQKRKVSSSFQTFSNILLFSKNLLFHVLTSFFISCKFRCSLCFLIAF